MPQASESKFPWLNVIQFPFNTREYDTGEGWLSYVDQGRGRPVVFVHGNPTWGYLYRHVLRDLTSSYRCIAPDMLGFGLSDKPQGADYRPEAQAARFAAFMDYLRVDDVTLVVNCAGGPVGLSWAMDHPERVRDLVMFNTWLWPLHDNRAARRIARLSSHPLNHIFYRWLKAAPAFILPAFFADRHCISRSTTTQYLEPFRDYADRQGVYAMIEGLTKSRKWFEELWAKRELIADKRALLMWGLKDPLFGEDALERFEALFTNRHSIRVETCGRFVPEESPQAAVSEMRWFLTAHSLSEAAR